MAENCNVDANVLLRTMWYYENELKNSDLEELQNLLPLRQANPLIAKPKCPSIFIEKACSLLQPQVEGTTRVEIVKRGKFLVEFARAKKFVEGRNPLGIAAAVLFFSLETFSLNKYLTKQGKQRICDGLSVKIATANERYKEIVECLIEESKPYFPQEITKKNIGGLYEEFHPILLETLQNQQPDDTPLPPSFVASEKIRQQRLEILNRVKEKIQQTLEKHQITHNELLTQSPLDTNDNMVHSNSKPVDLSWTSEELKMEKLLLLGVPEEEILAGYTDQDASTIKLNRNHDLDSNEITDLDMPESEVSQYLTGKRKKKRSS
eukprot:CAMPEP_0206191294 /NCGR_PEP_ID=MMETSP0166-20121206/5276_1 /ASSEMBLY_ACC=CAM_ASM_000260 /TAXON_ID=95228 /ORGANISM="Vannella robusta, Strain DIVA3 518/3/11/1/6" /LENGTH=320 /DNA_ID=CAMNT_0053607569 /DNA_START=300 /DNA_END=1259 /DNA_ORIENTATION=+